MATYAMITTVDSQSTDADGNQVTVPAGTVVNMIEWDGVSEYTPPDGTRLEQSITLRIGDIV